MPSAATDRVNNRRRFIGYLTVTVLAILGGMGPYLAYAVLATQSASSPEDAARVTSWVFAVYLLGLSLATPYGPWAAQRLGAVRLSAISRLAEVIISIATAILLAIQVPLVPMLIGVSLASGLVAGIRQPTTPLITEAYSGGNDLEVATAQLRRASGVAYAIGALGAGLVLAKLGPEPVFIIAAVLGVPVVVFLFIRPPNSAVKVDKTNQPWRSMIREIRTRPNLRWAVWLGVAGAILMSPMINMIVPVLNKIGHAETEKAGLLLMFFALGEIVTPNVVGRLGKGRRAFVAGVRVVQLTGASFLIMAVGVLLPYGPDLAVIAVGAILFGAIFYSLASFLYESSTYGAPAGEKSEILSAFLLAVGLAAPIGTLVWGHLLDSLATEVFFIAIAVVVIFILPAVLLKPMRALGADTSDDTKESNS